MKNEIAWNTKDGKEVKVEIELQTKKTLFADGYNLETECCELNIRAIVGGEVVGYGRPEKANHPVAVAKIGKLGITKENLDKINDAIAAIEDTPEWRTKIEKEMKAEKAGREYEAHRAKMRKIMGY